MKTTLFFKQLLIACILCIVGAGSAWAEELTATFTYNTTDGLKTLGITPPSASDGTNLGTNTYTVEGITMSTTDGKTATRIWNSSSKYDLRIYKSDGSITFTAKEGYTITKVVFAGTASLTYNSKAISNNTWTSTDGVSSVTFTANGTSKIQTATVTYESASSSEVTVSAPVIADAAKSFTEEFTTTITCPTEGASIYYTLDGTAPTAESTLYTESGVTIPAATTTLQAIAVKDGVSSKIASATYTYVESENIYQSIAALKAAAESGKDYYLNFNNVVVTDKNGYNVYMQDATAGILFYSNTDAGNYAKGDVLNGVAKVTYTVFKNKTEITVIDGTLTKTTTTDIPCTTVDLNTLLANMAKYESMRVKIELGYTTEEFGDYEATFTDDGENTITLYKAKGTKFAAAAKNAYISVEGYPVAFQESSSSNVVNELQVYAGYITPLTESTTISKYGYSTLYCADAFIVPEGMSAYTVVSNGDALSFSEYAAGTTVPAKTGVVLAGEASKECAYQLSADATAAPTDNLLHGTTTAAQTNAGDGTYKYYMLSAKDGKAGFYYGAADGAAFQNAAHKAYLAIPATMSAAKFQGFSLDELHGNTTGIHTAETATAAAQSAYDLNGRRINLHSAQKGIYIVGGKKVLVK